MDQKTANSIIREIRNNYNTIWNEWNKSRFKPSALKLKMIKKCENLLDLGCGNGLIIPVAVKKAKHYTGVDISGNLLSAAKDKYENLVAEGKVSFRVADARKLPFKNKSFDLILCFAMLHHVPGEKNRQAVMDEIYRVLTPGGTAIIINWNLLNDWPEKRFHVKKQLTNLPKGFDAGDVMVPWITPDGTPIERYVHIFSTEELKDMAKKSGFKKPVVTYYNRAGELTKNGEEIVLKIKKSD